MIGDGKNLIPIPKASIGVKTSKLPKAIPSESGIYAIWSNDDLMYVGEVGDKLKLTGRLKQHLFSCSASTASKLDKVINENKDTNKQISVSVILVEPIPFRLALEDEIIRIETDKKLAPWNKRSASAGEKKKWVLDRIKKSAYEFVLAMCGGNDSAAKAIIQKMKPKKSIAEDVLQSQFFYEYGRTANYNEIIDALIAEKKLKRTPNGAGTPDTIEVAPRKKKTIKKS